MILSNKLNIAFIAAAEEGFGVNIILKAYEEYKEYSGPNQPDWHPIEIKNDDNNKRSIRFLELNDILVAEFVDAMQQIEIGGVRDIFTSHHQLVLFDDYSLTQYGRYFETPHFSHRFHFLRRFVDLTVLGAERSLSLLYVYPDVLSSPFSR